ncbi:MAG: hypothetical protein JXB49_30280 [Bacteroidales bacterium]|nr:hypothetical protein [Bacteroidales bacterium]
MKKPVLFSIVILLISVNLFGKVWESRTVQSATGNASTDTKNLQDSFRFGVKEINGGVVYVPCGNYLVNDLIKVIGKNGTVRIVGIPNNGIRPKIILKSNLSAYSNANNPKSVIEFYQDTLGTVIAAMDAFYSQWENIDIEIQNGNPGAVAIKLPGAQGCHIRNCKIEMVSGKIGIDGLPGDAVNENIEIIGGSVGVNFWDGVWPSTLKGCSFTGQTYACITGTSMGVIFEGCKFENSPIGIEVFDNREPSYTNARIYLENCIFKNMNGSSKSAIEASFGNRNDWAIVLKNVYFYNAAKIISWGSGGTDIPTTITNGWCKSKYTTYGARWENGVRKEGVETNPLIMCHREVVNCTEPVFDRLSYVDIIPDSSACTNIMNIITVTNDSNSNCLAIQQAINNATGPLWFPMGTYKINNTITLKKDTKLIGEHPYYTDFLLTPNQGDASFSYLNNPKPIIATDDDPSGTAIFANFRFKSYEAPKFTGLISILWRVGHNSILDCICSDNSINYGHFPNQTGYAAIVIDSNGGGHVREIWAPWDNVNGPGTFIIKGTKEPLFLYGISPEHCGSKPAVYIENAKNVTFRQLQDEKNGGIVYAINSSNLILNSVIYNQQEPKLPSAIGLNFINCNNVEVYTFGNQNHLIGTYQYPTEIQFSKNDKVLATIQDDYIAAFRFKNKSRLLQMVTSVLSDD